MIKKVSIINGPAGGKVTGILENQTAYNIIENEAEDSAEITMYGEVVENRPRSYWTEDGKDDRLYIVLSEFLNDLEKVKDRSKLTVRINSPGGNLYAGLAIMNRLSELKGDVVTIVDGLAASAASIIMQGGKKRKVHKGCLIMVHEASTFLFGYYKKSDLEETLERLDAANRTAVEAYAEKTGLNKEEIRSIMERTTWMTGQEAIDKGFADELIDSEEVSMSISQDHTYMTVNGIRIPTGGFESLPDGIMIEEVIPGKEPVVADKGKDKGGNDEMTAAELRVKYPELVAEIKQGAQQQKDGSAEEQQTTVNDAVKAERKRISEIEEIANAIGDKELIHKAKFEEPMTAAQLALEAMKQQAKAGEQFMQNSEDDVKASGAKDVTPLPEKGIFEEMSASDIASGAALIAGTQEGE